MRLATYENAKEGAYLKALFQTGSGELENSVFAILSPDAKAYLVPAGRSPRMVFGTAQRMAQSMEEIGSRYHGSTATSDRLPKMANVRLALNVAACDDVPLVIAVGRTAKEERALEQRLANWAWNSYFAGRAEYATATNLAELSMISGAKPASGYVVVQPDRFGQQGTVIATIDGDAKLPDQLWEAIGRYQSAGQKDTGSHISAGRQKGVYWQTVIPVTDPGPRGR
ncbi:MAG: hypothetical protein AB7S38_10675 [Vulcanimicrobiota bacterium]